MRSSVFRVQAESLPYDVLGAHDHVRLGVHQPIVSVNRHTWVPARLRDQNALSQGHPSLPALPASPRIAHVHNPFTRRAALGPHSDWNRNLGPMTRCSSWSDHGAGDDSSIQRDRPDPFSPGGAETVAVS